MVGRLHPPHTLGRRCGVVLQLSRATLVFTIAFSSSAMETLKKHVIQPNAFAGPSWCVKSARQARTLGWWIGLMWMPSIHF